MQPVTSQYNFDGDSNVITIKLNNSDKIEKNKNVIVKIGDIRNPPSYFPLKGFEFRTGDHDRNFIEAATDGVL